MIHFPSVDTSDDIIDGIDTSYMCACHYRFNQSLPRTPPLTRSVTYMNGWVAILPWVSMYAPRSYG